MGLHPQTPVLPTDGHRLRKRVTCTHSPFLEASPPSPHSSLHWQVPKEGCICLLLAGLLSTGCPSWEDPGE